MRIAYDTSPLATQRSGVGNYTAYLLEHLQQHTDDAIIPVTHNGQRRMNKTLWMQTRLRRDLRAIAPDITHFTNGVAPLGLRRPFVLTIHDMTLWSQAEHHPIKRRLAMRPIMPLAARQAAAVITPSQSVRAAVVERLGIPPERVHVVYEAAAGHFAACPPPAACRSLAQHLEGPFILFVGTLEPRKNLNRLLAAYAELHRRLPHKLVITGAPGWMTSSLTGKIEALGLGSCVWVTGYVPNEMLHALYHRAAALVYPSLEEGFGLPIVEAMSAGTPVITSHHGAMAEIAGGAAHLVDPYRVEAIAAGIAHVLEDHAHATALTKRGRARAATFTWGRAAAETRIVYTHALERLHA